MPRRPDSKPSAAASWRQGLDAALEAATDLPEPGAILANELLDALPVHRVEGGPGGNLLERFVAIGPNDGFEERLGPPSTAALAERLDAEGIRLEPGQVAEICLALDAWIATAAATLERGELLLIDYGHPAAHLYARIAAPPFGPTTAIGSMPIRSWRSGART